MESFLSDLMQWLLAHPHWASAVVFLISLSESLIVVGLFVPGTIVMPFIGALVALGAMGLWETLFWAILGAIVGDGISFWIGHHYREHLRNLWPFTKHPEWLTQAESFFYRHGGKSVLFGRFVGPVRPIIPAVAGMLGMPPRFFYLVNVLSALLWAPAYMLPGIILGASLSLAATVGPRLVFLMLAIILLLWLSAWLVRRFYLFLVPKFSQGLQQFITVCERHHWVWGISLEHWSPRHPRLLAMLELLGLLLLAALTFAILLSSQLYREGPLGLDNQLYYLLQKLRSPWGDHFMIMISRLADWQTGLIVLTAGLLWLAWNHYWKGLLYWSLVLLIGAVMALLLGQLLPAYPPMQQAVVDMRHHLLRYAPITVNTIVYGFLAVLLAANIRPAWRRFPYTVFASWILLVLFSQLYLAQHWLSDLLLAVTLSLFWVGVLGFAYHRHHPVADVPVGGLIILVWIVFIGGGFWQVSQHYTADKAVYAAIKQQQRFWASTVWWNSAWQKLPAYRLDWEGYEVTPLTIQYGGRLSTLQNALIAQGWQLTTPLNSRSAIQWLVPDAPLSSLPILPNVHQGRHEQLALVLPGQSGNNDQLVLRLWETDVQLDAQQRLWVGNITHQQLKKTSLGLLNLPVTTLAAEEALLSLQSLQPVLQFRAVKRPIEMQPPVHFRNWSGLVILLHE